MKRAWISSPYKLRQRTGRCAVNSTNKSIGNGSYVTSCGVHSREERLMPEMVYGCRSKLRNFGQVALDRGLGKRFKNESMFFSLCL
jgi:hypothetical protein